MDGATVAEDGNDPAAVELRILGGDGDESWILRRALEMPRVEEGMIEFRQAAEDKKGGKADIDGREGADFPGARHESRPAIERPAADIERIEEHRDNVLHEEAEAQPAKSAGKHDQRQPNSRPLRQQLFELFERQRRMHIEVAEAFLAETPCRLDRALGLAEFGYQTVGRVFRRAHDFPTRWMTSRISKIDTTGKN